MFIINILGYKFSVTNISVIIFSVIIGNQIFLKLTVLNKNIYFFFAPIIHLVNEILFY